MILRQLCVALVALAGVLFGGNGPSFGETASRSFRFYYRGEITDLSARFEIGFPIPADERRGEVGGYHCWAWFFSDSHGWIPVDISEADKDPERKDYFFGNLTEHRVAFTTGRDLMLVPRQKGPPLNYFIYPYAEVEGKPASEQQVKTRFSFEE